MAESSERLLPKPMCDPTPVCPCNNRPFLRVAWWYENDRKLNDRKLETGRGRQWRSTGSV